MAAVVFATRVLGVVPDVDLVSSIGDGDNGLHGQPDYPRLDFLTRSIARPVVRMDHPEVGFDFSEHRHRSMALRQSPRVFEQTNLHRARGAVQGRVRAGGRS